jgi:phosphoribosylaminoimidazolecarboxamide formyltransferase / IMP cyclohydrolase
VKVRRALVSVSDKTGLVPFARGLADLGIELISTGGTAGALREAGLEVVTVEELTGQPEILGGRVKTLHPRIHGGILARPDHPEDLAEVAEQGIELIDLVVVNLYPFQETAARAGAARDEIVEQIDIGGPAMIRAAAKNHARVGVVTSPTQYDAVLEELRADDGNLSSDTCRWLALDAFRHTSRYDAAIAEWMSMGEGDFPDYVTMEFEKLTDLVYGENPHQRAAYYADYGARTHLLARVEQFHGKALSFNNLLDLDAARALASEFELPACVIVKHNNPCGVAVAQDVNTAYERALACDPVSAYGGVIVVNRRIDAVLGERLASTFVEVLMAPGFEEEALAALTRKPNTRLLDNRERRRANPGERDLRRVLGGILFQDRDTESEERETMQVVTAVQPTEPQWGDLLFAWRVAKHVKSNAIVLAKDLATVGIGAGQMSRVDSVRIATEKAATAELDIRGSALASDAFFPFPDGPETAISSGVAAIVQPGGSIRDDEIIAACDRLGAAMVFTGRRHFRH